ncbi:MAG: hypothetical protein ACOC6F_01120 [bacterium]
MGCGVSVGCGVLVRLGVSVGPGVSGGTAVSVEVGAPVASEVGVLVDVYAGVVLTSVAVSSPGEAAGLETSFAIPVARQNPLPISKAITRSEVLIPPLTGKVSFCL